MKEEKTKETRNDHKAILKDVPSYSRFLPVWEIDKIATELSILNGVSCRDIGETIEGEPLRMIEVGKGEKTALVIGVPHSDEPLGSLVSTFMARWIATHPDVDSFGWRWLFIPVLERRGMRLNEGWFNTPVSFSAMAKSYFREPTEDQYEWTFPIDYGDYKWTKSRPETLAVKKVLEEEKPDMLCGLHHCGFNDAYFYMSEELPEAYGSLGKLASSLRMNLSDNAPDVPFGESLSPGFYKMYGLRDYIDYYKEKDPGYLTTIRRGACSDEWYQEEIGGFSFNCEVPLYISPKSRDKNPSSKQYKNILEEKYNREKNRVAYSERLLKKLEPYSGTANQHLLESAKKHMQNARASLEHQKRFLITAEDKKITKAEAFDVEVMSDMFDLFFMGQIWRVAESICVRSGGKACKLADSADMEIQNLAKSIQTRGSFYQLPIRTAVKMQTGSILIIADALANRK